MIMVDGCELGRKFLLADKRQSAPWVRKEKAAVSAAYDISLYDWLFSPSTRLGQIPLASVLLLCICSLYAVEVR